MSDEQPTDTDGATPAEAKPTGPAPTVTARRPITKAEYARTTTPSPDSTAVIPAVRDDQPAPNGTSAESAAEQTAPVEPAAADSSKPAAKKVPAKTPIRKTAKKAPAKKAPATTAAAAAAAGAGASAAPAAPVAPASGDEPTAVQPQVASAAPPKPAPTPAPAQTAATTATAPAASDASARSAKLKLTHVEPWTVTKMAFVVSVALMIVAVVAVTVFWVVMQVTGVWGALNDSVANVLADDSSGFDITDYLGFGRLVGLTLLVSALNVIFMTALATIAAHLYNLSSTLIGGIELTFSERQ